MTAAFTTSLHLTNEDETSQLAAHVALHLKDGDCLLLSGPIGAGKTHFARALIQKRLSAAGLMEDVPSPTFTLVQTYFDGISEIWHADLYRLTHPDDVLELGLEDAFSSAITLIEWPDRLGFVPPGALHLEFVVEKDSRMLSVSSTSATWADRLTLEDALNA